MACSLSLPDTTTQAAHLADLFSKDADGNIIPGTGPYLSRDAEGKRIYKTYDQVNADVMAQVQPQIDPAKPAFLPQMLCNGIQGGVLIEAKERNPARAFLHIVSWNEFRPYLDELADASLRKAETAYKQPNTGGATPEQQAGHLIASAIAIRELKVRDQYNPDGSMVDFSWEDVGQITDELRADILHRILIARKADLRRGDAVHMQFVNYRCYGTYFYNGEKVILPEDEDSDYYHVPSIFKVPTEFGIDYWSDCGFTGYSHVGDVCFDVAATTGPFSPIEECKIKRIPYSWQPKPTDIEPEVVAFICTVEVKGDTWNIIMPVIEDDNYEGRLDSFENTGLCWDVGRLGNEFSDGEIDLITAGMDPKRILVI